ncbi:unnamed protein product [Ixodes hexagonus]
MPAAASPTWLCASVIAGLIVFIILLVGFFVVTKSVDPGEVKAAGRTADLFHSCLSRSCQRILQLTNIHQNTSSNACADLYSYSCVHHGDHGGRSLRSRLETQEAQNTLSSVRAQNEVKNPALAKTAAFYKTCVGAKTRSDSKSLQGFLKQQGLLLQQPQSLNFSQLIFNMAARFGVGLLIQFDSRQSTSPGARGEDRTLLLNWNQNFWVWKTSGKQLLDPDVPYLSFVAIVHQLGSGGQMDSTEEAALSNEIALTEKVVWEIIDSTYNGSGFQNLTFADFKKRLVGVNPDALSQGLYRSTIPYFADDRFLVKGANLLHCLQTILNTVKADKLAAYLSWEAARQMASFFLPALSGVPLKDTCVYTAQMLLGRSAVLLPSILKHVTQLVVEGVQDIFASIRRASVATIVRAGFGTTDDQHLSALIARLEGVRLTIAYPDSIETLPHLNSRLDVVSNMSTVFMDNYISVLEASWKLGTQNFDRAQMLGMHRSRVKYDSRYNTVSLPVEYLLPPLYAVDSFLAENYGTLGTALAVGLWLPNAPFSGNDVDNSTLRSLAEHHAGNFQCVQGTTVTVEDVFSMLAMEIVTEAFEWTLEERSAEASVEDWQLLFVASCLASCGSHSNFWKPTAARLPKFRSVFQCATQADQMGPCRVA